MGKKIILLFVLIPVLLMAQVEKKQDVWEPMKFLLGEWEGQGDGKSGISEVWKEWHFVLNGQFLQMKTKAVFKPQEKNPKGEIHEDLGYFSYDGARQQIVFRQFHVEGFIIQYVLENVSDDGRTLTFMAEKIENGPPGLQAKIVYKIMDANTVEERFELAFPGREFNCFNTNVIKRKK
ncbi:MAG: hypothetical protein PVF22_08380 [Candidatus Aminicenantes bacterium]|jgi:hypothetical protein